jgi:branched-chain amino acid transport system ATP-binding protein
MSTPASLEVQNVSLRFQGLTALSAVSFFVEPGESIGLMGPNGAGKSSLMSVIAGSQRPSGGSIFIDGKRIDGLGAARRARLGLGRTFQIAQPFASMTVEENVMVGAVGCGQSLSEARAHAPVYIERVGLTEKRVATASSLSTGQRKRLELARALATSPRLLLLDEVMGGVDAPSVRGLVDLVASIRLTGVTLLIVEHNVRALLALVDRLIFLNRGEIVVDGPARSVMADPRVADLYMGKDPC